MAAKVRDIAHWIPSNMAPEPHKIPGEAIKLLMVIRPQRVAEVFNKCLTQEIFSTAWKRARLVLLRKDQKPLKEPSSYRPFYILASTGKLLEKVVDMRLKEISETRKYWHFINTDSDALNIWSM